MTLASHLSPTILSASINQIAPLFMQGAGADEPAARDAVAALLADYKPQTNEELTLAADIVHYRFLAIDNLTRSVEPDLSLTKVLRLRGSAVSLSREAHKAQRKLDKLQSARATIVAKPAAQPETATRPNDPAPPTTAELAARDIRNGENPIQPPPHQGRYGGQTYAQQLRKRDMAQTIKENAARNAAESLRLTADKTVAQVA